LLDERAITRGGIAMNIIVTGGFEANFSVGFAKGLAANGVEICVVSCDETAPRLTAAGIKNINLRGSVAEDRPAWRKLANLAVYYARLLLLLLRDRGATVHFTGMFRNELIIWEGLFLNYFFRLLAGRYIYTVHNVLPHGRGESGFYRSIYRRIYRMPHLLLTHTRLARRQLIEEFGVPADRIQLTSIGLNEEMQITGLTKGEARQRLCIGEKDRCVLFFGKIDEYKGLDLLLNAFDMMTAPGTRLLVAGGFRNAAYRCKIADQIKRMLRKDDVMLQERYIPNDEVEIFFKAADVLCLPYRNIYQSGLVFLGPRFGIPMVTTDVGSLREIVDEGFGVVTRTNDPAGIAEGLATVSGAPEKFSSAAIIARAQKYQWRNICRELAPLYSGNCAPSDSRIASPGHDAGTRDPEDGRKEFCATAGGRRL